MAKKLLLIDAHGYIHRAYHALPPLTTSKGESINAVYGFARMLLKLMGEQKADYFVICFDSKGPTFRHEMDPNYKATRKEADEELKTQFPLARELVKGMELPSFELSGYEADDLIATLAKKAEKEGIETLIVSGDKDLLQLVNEDIKVLSEPREILYDDKKVLEKWGVSPTQILDVLSLMGDSSDNVPGVQGIGEKTAVKLIQQLGSVDNLLSHLDQVPPKIKENLENSREQIARCRKILTLDANAPIEFQWEECRLKPLTAEKVEPLFRKWEFFALLKDLYGKGILHTSPSVKNSIPVHYKTILHEENFNDLLKTLKTKSSFAVDVETTGLDPRKCRLVGISFAWEKGSAAYIPLEHRYLGAPQQLESKKTLKALKEILEEPSIKKIGHHLKFDSSILSQAEIEINPIFFDTMIASYCLNPSRTSHGLKDLASEYLNVRMTKLEEILPSSSSKSEPLPVDQIEVETLSAYACADADVTFQLANHFSALLKEKECESLFFNMEMPLVKILMKMEMEGIKIDVPYLQSLDGEFIAQMREIEKKVFDLAGQEFNLNSSKQLAFILFEKLKLPVVRKTKTGFSTDEEVLHTLSPLHELPQSLLQFRELAKLKSTYIDGLLNAADAASSKIHTSFNQTGTQTGRLSSSDPNLQNIPIRTEYGRRIRRAFIPEEGRFFLSFDYSQIDLRVLAHLSGDENLIQAFKEGADIHRATARQISRNPRGEVSEEERKKAKAVNFGIVYGQQAFGLSQSLKIPFEEAQRMIDQYFAKYPGVKEWIASTIQKARQTGYVKTLLGRTRYIPEISAKNGAMKSFAERVAMNTPVQGTSADIIKIAMINIYEKLQKHPKDLGCKMLIQVHDDLLFEAPESKVRDAAHLIKAEMENAVQLSVPVLVDVKYGKNWADMERLKE